ncbi:MAG: pseudouridine-5'-phosphate glycosidase [Actinomycetota bacterium]|nr:pseudouridine-5'-phosphate glycosidase [Actinomycetota bacterium]
MAGGVIGGLEIAPRVAGALEEGRPVVALETSVLAQGLPAPANAEAADRMSSAVRGRGAEPAWTWVDGGRLRVGASEQDLGRLLESEAAKVARRDLPMALARGGLGATTVSATLWIARRSGIEVSATGGVGGVHPGSTDVSADLLELAESRGALICSGPKSILDPVATLERLEELGVGLLGYRTDRLPHFVVRETALILEHRVDDPASVAGVITAQRELGTPSTIVVCNPCPLDAALDAETVEGAVAACAEDATRDGIHGKDITPFLLRCLAERTDGRSLRANLSLLEANAGLAAEVASELPGM